MSKVIRYLIDKHFSKAVIFPDTLSAIQGIQKLYLDHLILQTIKHGLKTLNKLERNSESQHSTQKLITLQKKRVFIKLMICILELDALI